MNTRFNQILRWIKSIIKRIIFAEAIGRFTVVNDVAAEHGGVRLVLHFYKLRILGLNLDVYLAGVLGLEFGQGQGPEVFSLD